MIVPSSVVNIQYSLEKNWRAYTKGSTIVRADKEFILTGPWNMNGETYTKKSILKYPGNLKMNELATPVLVNVKVKSLGWLALFLCLFLMLISSQVFKKVVINDRTKRSANTFIWILILGTMIFGGLLIYYGCIENFKLMMFAFAFIGLMGVLGLIVIGYCDKSWIKGYFIVSTVCMIVPLIIYKSLLFIFPILGLVLGYLVFLSEVRRKKNNFKNRHRVDPVLGLDS